MRFFEGHAFGAANLVIARGVAFTLGGAGVIEYGNTSQVGAETSRLAANHLFAPDERDAGETLGGDERGSAHRAVIFAFRQDDVLRISSGARANLIEDTHGAHCSGFF